MLAVTATDFRTVRETSPRTRARLAGLLYLIVILGGGYAEIYVRQALVVHGNAAATLANIAANEQLYRLGFLADLVPLLCNVLLAVLFYNLFRIVNRNIALLAVIFSLIGSAVQASVMLFHLMPLMLGGSALAGLGQAQLASLAYLAIRLQANGYSIALVFFGCFGICIGTLIWKARFMPRVIGPLMMLAGACYLTNSLLNLVVPPLSSTLLFAPCLVGEGALMLWLLLAGVNTTKWKLQAGEAL